MNASLFSIKRDRLVDCYVLLIEAAEKNTPTESSTVYQAGQDKVGAEANQPIQAGEQGNPSTRRTIQQTEGTR